MKVELLDYTDYPENKIVSIAKLSHGKDVHKVYSSEEVERFIKQLLKWKHFSVFEHAYATFYYKCSLVCTHQLVRHRLFSFLQKSRRYTKDDPNFIVPESMKNNDDVYNHLNQSMKLYTNLIKNGIAAEDARFVLPTGLETEIVVTGNFREWMHFLKLRTDNHAQWEIRNIANKTLELLNQVAPTIFNKENISKFE